MRTINKVMFTILVLCFDVMLIWSVYKVMCESRFSSESLLLAFMCGLILTVANLVMVKFLFDNDDRN